MVPVIQVIVIVPVVPVTITVQVPNLSYAILNFSEVY
jgi:hypothetical protein